MASWFNLGTTQYSLKADCSSNCDSSVFLAFYVRFLIMISGRSETQGASDLLQALRLGELCSLKHSSHSKTCSTQDASMVNSTLSLMVGGSGVARWVHDSPCASSQPHGTLSSGLTERRWNTEVQAPEVPGAHAHRIAA